MGEASVSVYFLPAKSSVHLSEAVACVTRGVFRRELVPDGRKKTIISHDVLWQAKWINESDENEKKIEHRDYRARMTL